MTEPCMICWDHPGIFRWQNFPCAPVCAMHWGQMTEAERSGMQEVFATELHYERQRDNYMGKPVIGFPQDHPYNLARMRLKAGPSRTPKCYAFDVDETLEISRGPVTLQSVRDLRAQGHITGIVGNWGVFCALVPDWWQLASFVNCSPVTQGPDGVIYGDKAWWLKHFATYCRADEYMMVGNVFGAKNSLGYTCGSHDSEAAQIAGWRFIKEDDFAAGVR